MSVGGRVKSYHCLRGWHVRRPLIQNGANMATRAARPTGATGTVRGHLGADGRDNVAIHDPTNPYVGDASNTRSARQGAPRASRQRNTPPLQIEPPLTGWVVGAGGGLSSKHR